MSSPALTRILAARDAGGFRQALSDERPGLTGDDRRFLDILLRENRGRPELQEAASSAIDSLISGLTLPDQKLIYTLQDHSGPVYTRNPSCWTAPFVQAMTCISPWNTDLQERKAGTLVTPRHMIGAAHYQIPVGETVRFIGIDNAVHDRQIVAKTSHPDYDNFYPDLTVYLLHGDLPDITPCPVAPADIESRFSDLNAGVPALILNQDEDAHVADLYTVTYLNQNKVAHRQPTDPDRLALFENLAVGDSGNPTFIVVGNQLILTTVLTTGGGGSGTFIGAYIDDINQMIAVADADWGIDTGYTLTVADFSGFRGY